MRKKLLSLLTAATLIALTACTNSTSNTTPSPAPAQSETLPKTDTLVIYTSMKDSLMDALVVHFADNNPDIGVEVLIEGAGNLMIKIDEERDSGKIYADMIWTSEVPDFYYLKSQDLLAQYRPAGADNAFNPLEESDDYFFPARLGTMGIAYNTQLVTTPPTAWSDLFGETYKDGFAIANPETSGTAMMGIALLKEAFGTDFFANLKANGTVVGGGSTSVIDSVADGSIAACLAVDYITFDKANSGSPIALAYPQEMLVIPSPAAIFKDSDNLLNAQKFADFLLSAEAQTIIAESGTLPVLDGIAVPDEYNIPAVADAKARAIDIEHSKVFEQKAQILRDVLSIMWD